MISELTAVHLKALGLPNNATKTRVQLNHRAKHHIKTTAGVTKKHYQSTTDCLLFGEAYAGEKLQHGLQMPMLMTQGIPMSMKRNSPVKLQSQSETPYNIPLKHGSVCSLDLVEDFAPRKRSCGSYGGYGRM
eukprot:13726514-Ditylum_brightwellii.AAC.1